MEYEGFKAFVAGLDPSYKLPSRATLRNALLPQLYASVVEDVQIC